jgi:hypothetical protein
MTGSRSVVSFLTMALMAAPAFGGVNAETEAAAKNLGAAKVTEISFGEGNQQMNDTLKQDVKKFIQEARGNGKVKEVRLVVWADREYPPEGVAASPQDIHLAQGRADELESFLKKDLKVSKVTTYNMAQRPNTIQKWFGTKTAATKGNLEATGAAPKTSNETGVLSQKAQASKAVLMVFM